MLMCHEISVQTRSLDCEFEGSDPKFFQVGEYDATSTCFIFVSATVLSVIGFRCSGSCSGAHSLKFMQSLGEFHESHGMMQVDLQS